MCRSCLDDLAAAAAAAAATTTTTTTATGATASKDCDCQQRQERQPHSRGGSYVQRRCGHRSHALQDPRVPSPAVDAAADATIGGPEHGGVDDVVRGLGQGRGIPAVVARDGPRYRGKLRAAPRQWGVYGTKPT